MLCLHISLCKEAAADIHLQDDYARNSVKIVRFEILDLTF
jgi:hypothetical protein